MAVSKKKTTSNNPPSTISHPPYLQMICEAIMALKDRMGSSQPAISKFIEGKYQSLLLPNFKKLLSVQLKKFVKSEKLVKVKKSYKISDSEKVKLVASSIKVSEKKKDVEKTVITRGNSVQIKATKKKTKKSEKTKRLCQVKTPEPLKMKSVIKKAKNKESENSVSGAKKMKRLSQVKTPEKLKKKKKKKAVNSSNPASKKVRP